MWWALGTQFLGTILYFPPLWVWMGNGFFKRWKFLTYPIVTFPTATAIGLILYALYPAQGFIWASILFMAFNILAYLMSFDKVTAFSLSIYAVFAIAELWEWPIHLYSWNSVEAFANGLSLSLFKSLAIPFFFAEIWRRGWRPTPKWGISLLVTFQIGLMLYIMYPMTMWDMPLYGWQPYFNLYRIPWIILFAWCILD